MCLQSSLEQFLMVLQVPTRVYSCGAALRSRHCPPPDKRDSGAVSFHSEVHSVFVLAITDALRLAIATTQVPSVPRA